MIYAVLFAQVVAEMPPAPAWLIGFTIFAVSAAVVWMSLLVRHAAREEHEYKQQLKQRKEGAGQSSPPRP
jgi:hypothetical protein